jgi:hypothetical protein
VNVVFEECLGRRFRLSHVDLRTAGSGFTAPCRDVLIVVSDEVPDMNQYKKFDDLSESEFERQVEDDPLLKQGRFVSFRFTSEEDSEVSDDEDDFTAKPVNLPLSPLLEGRYVLVKLIRPRSGENIDMEFVGFLGQVNMEVGDEEDEKSNQDVYASRRYLVDTSGPGALSQIGMCFFASLIESFDDEDLKSSLRNDSSGPLRQILNQLKSQRPLQLFSEWSPPRVPPQDLLKLRLEMASSTFTESSKHAKYVDSLDVTARVTHTHTHTHARTDML